MDQSYETLAVSLVDGSPGVAHVRLNRPKKMNAVNPAMWTELRDCFTRLDLNTEVRAIVLSGEGRAFTAGLDLTSAVAPKGSDHGRKAFHLRRHILSWQESFNAIERCHQPVIAAIHGPCIGAGIDMSSACDIRYASADAYFSIKEVDVGLAADVGTLQRLPKIIGNEGLVRELAYTARNFTSDEALKMGFVSAVTKGSREEVVALATKLAAEIATKSPLAVAGTKRMITYTRDHSVADSLDYVATWNSGALLGKDMLQAIQAHMKKQKGTFSKL